MRSEASEQFWRSKDEVTLLAGNDAWELRSAIRIYSSGSRSGYPG